MNFDRNLSTRSFHFYGSFMWISETFKLNNILVIYFSESILIFPFNLFYGVLVFFLLDLKIVYYPVMLITRWAPFIYLKNTFAQKCQLSGVFLMITNLFKKTNGFKMQIKSSQK